MTVVTAKRMTCKQCDGTFTRSSPGNGVARSVISYCSPECRDAADKARRRERARAKRETEVEELRDRVRCEWCGEPLEDAVRVSRRFCSGRCRVAAYRRRQDLMPIEETEICGGCVELPAPTAAKAAEV